VVCRLNPCRWPGALCRPRCRAPVVVLGGCRLRIVPVWCAVVFRFEPVPYCLVNVVPVERRKTSDACTADDVPQRLRRTFAECPIVVGSAAGS